ncbi:MAG TPA: UbiA family prenyltransferase [Dehalococcoidia bacterium]|nr:UbiA family prenyltransferase [Dehalococcoidia bacterium]
MQPTEGKTASSEAPTRKPPLRDRARGWAAATHPFPLSAVLVLTALIGVASARGEPDPWRMALMLSAMLLSQMAIGWSNDYLDRETDSLSQPWKPVPSGLVDAARMPPAIGAALLGSFAAGAFLGAWPLALLLVGTAAGFAYNLGVKDTALSPLPYVVALAVLPAFGWASLGVFREDFLLLYPIAFPLAVAAHAANALPDLELDRDSGRGGVAMRLGRSGTLALVGACLMAPLASLAASFPFVGYDREALFAFAAAYCVAAGAAGVAYASGRDRGAWVWGFRLVLAAAVVFAAGWLTAVT